MIVTGNDIGDKGAAHIAEIMKRSPNIASLDLRCKDTVYFTVLAGRDNIASVSSVAYSHAWRSSCGAESCLLMVLVVRLLQ